MRVDRHEHRNLLAQYGGKATVADYLVKRYPKGDKGRSGGGGGGGWLQIGALSTLTGAKAGTYSSTCMCPLPSYTYMYFAESTMVPPPPPHTHTHTHMHMHMHMLPPFLIGLGQARTKTK